MNDLKLGKRPFSHDPRDLSYERYAEALSFTPPAHDTDNLARVAEWRILGNDHYGDCVFAGAAHETMLWTTLGGALAPFSDEAVLSDYSKVTGFNAADPASDQGTKVRDALRYRRGTGIVDAEGRRHRIAAFLALEPGNHAHVREALHLFDGVGIGLRFPASAMDQFKHGKPWTVVSGPAIEGGHYVPLIGYTGRSLYCVTWGRVQRMTWTFFSAYADECWALLSAEFLNAGRSPEGLDLPALKADLAAL